MKNIIVQILIIILFFLPNTGIFLLIYGLIPIGLFLLFGDKQSIKFKYKYLVVFLISISLFGNLIFYPNDVDQKAILRALSLALIFSTFPFLTYVKVNNSILYLCIMIILLSQLSYVFGVDSLMNFFNNTFPYQGDLKIYSQQYLNSISKEPLDLTLTRFGGLYYNPNNTARFVTLLLAVFLINNQANGLGKKIPFLGLVLGSIILAGSRTGFIITIVLILMSIICLENDYKRNIKLLVFVFIVTASFLIYSTMNPRIFEISEGFHDSISTKIGWFSKFLGSLNSPFRLFFGHFSPSSISEYNSIMMDSEYGELFFNYGLIGFLGIFYFLFKLIQRSDTNSKFYLIILFWGFSNTILFSFRMSYLFMFFLSIYFSKSNEDYFIANHKST